MKMGLESAITKRDGIKAVRRWSSGAPNAIKIKVEIAEEDGFGASYEFAIGSDKRHDYRVKYERATIIDPKTGTHEFIIEDAKIRTAPGGINPSLNPLGLALQLISGDERFSRLEQALRNLAIYNIFPDTLRSPQKYDPAKPMHEHGGNWASILKDQG